MVAVLPFVPDGGLRELYDTTIGFQLGRGSPFSLWALHPSLDWLQPLLKAALPRWRSPLRSCRAGASRARSWRSRPR